MNISSRAETLSSHLRPAMQSAAEPCEIAGIAAPENSTEVSGMISPGSSRRLCGIAPRRRRRLSPGAARRPDHRGEVLRFMEDGKKSETRGTTAFHRSLEARWMRPWRDCRSDNFRRAGPAMERMQRRYVPNWNTNVQHKMFYNDNSF